MDPTVASWRRQQRATLLAMRRTMPPDARHRATEIIAGKLDDIVATRHSPAVGLYLPIRHEINLLSWANEMARRENLVLCLPVVVTPKAPLEYWRWTQGEALARGIWNIPIPARRDVVFPGLMLAPLVGFDRTLASLRQRPMVIGIGYEFSALKTIFPQPHDIPMDAVLTERDTSPSDWRNHAG